MARYRRKSSHQSTLKGASRRRGLCPASLRGSRRERCTPSAPRSSQQRQRTRRLCHPRRNIPNSRPLRLHDARHEAPRVHHAARRRGGGVAAPGARAAASDAGDRISQPQFALTDIPSVSADFGRALGTPAMSRARTLRLNTAGPRVNSIGYQRWRRMVRRPVALIVRDRRRLFGSGGQAATTTIPIIVNAGDAVAKLIIQLARAGESDPKRLARLCAGALDALRK